MAWFLGAIRKLLDMIHGYWFIHWQSTIACNLRMESPKVIPIRSSKDWIQFQGQNEGHMRKVSSTSRAVSDFALCPFVYLISSISSSPTRCLASIFLFWWAVSPLIGATPSADAKLGNFPFAPSKRNNNLLPPDETWVKSRGYLWGPGQFAGW